MWVKLGGLGMTICGFDHHKREVLLGSAELERKHPVEHEAFERRLRPSIELAFADPSEPFRHAVDDVEPDVVPRAVVLETGIA